MTGEYFRTGRRQPRTIYRQPGPDPTEQDEMVGVMDTPELAAEVVKALNARNRGREL